MKQPTAKIHPARQPAWSYGHRGYALLGSLRQLTQSRLATFLTLLVLGITMALPAVFLFLSDDLQALPIDTQRGQSITAYLDTALTDLQGAELAQSILQRSGVSDVEYISRIEALETFQRHSEFAEALAVLEDNPLPGAIVVYPEAQHQSRNGVELLANGLKALEGVYDVQVDLQWVSRLSAVLALMQMGAGLLVLFLIITALVVIANTLRLEMLQRSRETEVSRLLGATRRFVFRPYLYLGAIYGLLGGLVAVFLAAVIQLIISPSITRLALAYGSQFRLSLPSATQSGIILAVTTLLGLLGAGVILYRQFNHGNSAL